MQPKPPLDVLPTGMGTVYEAWEPALKRRVALKRLNIGRYLWKYYEREAEALGRLADEHIVTVFERGHDEPYIAIEFLDGKSLDKHLAENGRIPLRTAFRLWRQAVRGVMIAPRLASCIGIFVIPIMSRNQLVSERGEGVWK